MTIGTGWSYDNPIRIETLDDPVPTSLSIRRPFTVLRGDYVGWEGDYLKPAIGAVLGKPFFDFM